jgi:hypothetical protein
MNEKYPFQKEWYEYKRQRSFGCLTIVLIFLVFFLTRRFAPNFQQLIGILFIVFIIGNLVWLLIKGSWKCPRCKRDFHNYLSKRYPLKYCEHCNLPQYYGSSYFFDYWGVEKGNELIKKNEQVEVKK